MSVSRKKGWTGFHAEQGRFVAVFTRLETPVQGDFQKQGDFIHQISRPGRGKPHKAVFGLTAFGARRNIPARIIGAGTFHDIENLEAILFATQGDHQKPPVGGIRALPLTWREITRAATVPAGPWKSKRRRRNPVKAAALR